MVRVCACVAASNDFLLYIVIQSAEILCRDGASYPEYVEIHAKGHAIEAIEVSTGSSLPSPVSTRHLTLPSQSLLFAGTLSVAHMCPQVSLARNEGGIGGE